MPRTARIAPGGMIFHVLNRGVGRMRLFLKDADFEAFERNILKTLESRPMRICAYCLLSNHWHLVLWPERDGDLGAFMQKLTITHVRNWQENRHRVGYGHLYQGRYKSFPVESDDYFYQVVRYVERNALRANLVTRAEDWRWSSLWRRVHARSGGPPSLKSMALAPATKLGRAGQSAADRSGTGSDPPEPDPRSTLRKRDLGEEDGPTVGTGIDPPSSRPAAEKGILKHSPIN